MRKVEFEVPAEAMPEFAEELVSRDLNNSIVGVNDDNEIIVEVEYGRNESNDVDELEEILEKLCDNLEEEED